MTPAVVGPWTLVNIYFSLCKLRIEMPLVLAPFLGCDKVPDKRNLSKGVLVEIAYVFLDTKTQNNHTETISYNTALQIA